MRTKTLVCKLLKHYGLKDVTEIKEEERLVGVLKNGFVIVSYKDGQVITEIQGVKPKEFDICTRDIYS